MALQGGALPHLGEAARASRSRSWTRLRVR
jgi:hypothetical protein